MSDDLRAAARLAPMVDGRRLRLAREIHGWTQRQLLDEANGIVSTAALSQIEQGHSAPAPATFDALARALDYPLQFFVVRPTDADDEEPVGYFRSLRSTPARERRKALGLAHLVHDFVVAAERYLRLPARSVPHIRVPAADRIGTENAAVQVRSAWGIGAGPVANVVRELERHGVVTARLTIDNDRVDAFSVPFTDRPVVILAEDKNKPDRSRFDAAHELAHLVLHRGIDAGTKDAERQAHQFAAAFLMPADDIRDSLPVTADWGRLLDLKVEWGVSIAALLKRANTLGRLSDHAYLNAVKTMSARGWRKDEPGNDLLGAPESPLLLEACVNRLVADGHDIEAFYEENGLPKAEMRRLVTSSADPRPAIEF